MDDEGYTSPASEGIPYSSNNVKYEESMSLETIWKEPLVQEVNQTWDNLTEPMPHRFKQRSSSSSQINKNVNVPYLSNDTLNALKCMDFIWRIKKVTSNGDPPESQCVEELKTLIEKPYYVDTKCFIQHLLNLLGGRESRSFQYKDDLQTFAKSPVVLLHGITPTALANFCKPLIRTGTLVRILHMNTFQSPSPDCNTEGLNNSVFKAFLRFIFNFIKAFRIVLLLKGPSFLTLSQIILFIRPYSYQLEILNKILENYANESAVVLLSSLNTMLFEVESPLATDLIKNLFLSCSTSYLRYVSNWIFRGELGDPSEFHIERARSYDYNDRRFWTKQYVQKTCVPFFLMEIKDKILETGKAMNLLNRIDYQGLSTSLQMNSSTANLKLTMGFDDFENYSKEWNVKESCFFNENSHFILAIESTIRDVLKITSKQVQIDFNQVEFSRRDHIHNHRLFKLDAFNKKKEMQREIFQNLQSQVESAELRKIHAKEIDKEEEEKRVAYNLSKDKQLISETNKFANKYFDPAYVTTEQKELHLKLKSNFDDFQNEKDRIFNNSDETDESPVPTSGSMLTDNEESKVEEEKTSNFEVHLEEAKVFNFNQVYKIPSQKVPPIEHEREKAAIEEKFNPNKIAIKDTIKYSTEFASHLGKPLVVSTVRANKKKSNEEMRLKLMMLDSFSLNHFMIKTTSIPLFTHHRMVNAVLLHHIIVEKKLFHHIEALNSFLCLQNGLFGHFICEMLINEVQKNKLKSSDDLIINRARLNTILGDALSFVYESEETNEFVRHLALAISLDAEDKGSKSSAESFGLSENHSASESQSNLSSVASPSVANSIKKQKETSEYSILNNLKLTYSIEWPLNIILTDEMLIQYEKVFTFVMKLTRAELLLKRIYSLLKSKRLNIRQMVTLNHFRNRMLHLVRSLRCYVNVTVIHTSWTELCSNFHKMDTLEKIYDGLVKHIKNVTSNCLLGLKGEGAMKLLSSLLILIEIFCTNIERVLIDESIKFIDQIEFDSLCRHFKIFDEIVKVFSNVAFKLGEKGYYTKVSFFLQLYNFNGFFR